MRVGGWIENHAGATNLNKPGDSPSQAPNDHWHWHRAREPLAVQVIGSGSETERDRLETAAAAAAAAMRHRDGPGNDSEPSRLDSELKFEGKMTAGHW